MSKKLSSFPLIYKGTTYMNMVEVPVGSFLMENEDKENDTVRITFEKPFYIAEFPVTQELYEAEMRSNPSHFKGKKRPVENVSWHDAIAFIKKLNEETQKLYRLPSEAEWEYAARGGNKTHNFEFSGSENLDIVGWYEGNSNQETKLVGLKIPNELGIYEMSGNVWEWCEDWYDYNNTNRIFRGGSWFGGSSLCRTLDYYYNLPEYFSYILGFRLCSFLL